MDVFWRAWYPVVTRMLRAEGVSFLNYGYVGDGEGERDFVLEGKDEGDRACVGLYRRVVDGAELRGREVLEVSCGHGGGASYVKRYLGPGVMRGVDRNGRAIAFCQTAHAGSGVAFSVGDAMGLGFSEGVFDVVMNVEASHCYPDVGRFLGEVRRVLKSGGEFLYADFRDVGERRRQWEGEIARCGMEVVSCADISAGVLRAMEVNHEKYMGLIERRVPRVLWGAARRFSGVKGSMIYEALGSGETVYLCWRLRKG